MYLHCVATNSATTIILVKRRVVCSCCKIELNNASFLFEKSIILLFHLVNSNSKKIFKNDVKRTGQVWSQNVLKFHVFDFPQKNLSNKL